MKNMDDLISRQEAIDTVKYDYFTGYTQLERVNEIKALPAADVAPVVRCDDCVYYGSRRWCELHSSVFDDNAFCSYGERREE